MSFAKKALKSANGAKDATWYLHGESLIAPEPARLISATQDYSTTLPDTWAPARQPYCSAHKKSAANPPNPPPSQRSQFIIRRR
jgi:hypothetical protein